MGNLQATIPQTKYTKVNGTSLTYIEKGGGEPVVFIHCAVSDYRHWQGQFDFFSRDYKVVSYSRRGHFPNKNLDGDFNYSRAQHAADLIAFLKTLNFKKAHLIGHSCGASVALIAALESPELIGSLVLAEPSIFPNLLDERETEFLSEQKAGFSKAIRLAKNDKEEAARQFVHTIVGIDVFDILPSEKQESILENADKLDWVLQTYYDAPQVNCRKLKSIKIPILLITGELSPKIAKLNNEAINRCLPNSKIEILRGASHGLQNENPEDFNRMVSGFLKANRIPDI